MKHCDALKRVAERLEVLLSETDRVALALQAQSDKGNAPDGVQEAADAAFETGTCIDEAIEAMWRAWAASCKPLVKDLGKSKMGRPRLVAHSGFCLVDGCGGSVRCRGLCEAHYCRWKRGQAVSVPMPPKARRLTSNA